MEPDPYEDGTAKMIALNPCFAAVTRRSTRHWLTFAVPLLKLLTEATRPMVSPRSAVEPKRS
ncbi:hypothetical protein H6F86_19780 [Phormidium sp. FACHB-592]|uniref:Uncharacterized protein n=1 Tax=Stenomitos frigidus AS-A4 TaxID=2933935 RepID=A0ABV0KE02_9CYAN|nr:hypothetical protein [Phormidium sp. FACHB-592]MBD2076069.1 hypothetical protein [Phormidium sp. FACHB-592]